VVCQAFSGGVDSFHTLREHLPSRTGHPLTVTHAMMVHGYDVPLSDIKTFDSMSAAYGPLLQEMGVSLIYVSTNIREVTGRLNWEMTHGSALAFAGLALGPKIGSFIISSTCSYGDLIPWGSDPRSDHWLSGADTEIMHFGAHLMRSEKLIALTDWAPIRKGLRVCWEKPSGINNCCRCGKCLRTMMILKIKGVLDDFETFPLGYDRKLAMRLPYDDDILILSAKILMDLARTEGCRDIESELRAALRRQRFRDISNKIAAWFGVKRSP